jgi:hypothetical protein
MSNFQSAWSYSGPMSSDSNSTLINQFPTPPSSIMQQYPQQPQPICLETPVAYTAPAVISLGEEYTDDTLPQTSYISLENGDEGFDYDDDDDDSSEDEGYSPISSSSPSPTAINGQSTIPALWHAEHARLLHIQNAVLDNEREARSRELRLESEVARIKDDLARLKTARAQSFSTTIPALPSAQASCSTNAAVTSPTSVQAPPQQRACGPRGPRPRPQQSKRPSTLIRVSTSMGERQILASAATISQEPSSILTELRHPLLGKSPSEQDDETTETVLSNHLTEARSARAQERQKRKKENERIRELSMLLTLGSEVRKWEERLAWQQARAVASIPSSDDMNLESSTKSSNKDMDTDPDPRGKRLSRSFSLPSRGSYNPTSVPSTSATNRCGPPPALPSLAMSPLWRVSAEMILRRRSLSERPRRVPPKLLLPNAPTSVDQPEQQKEQPVMASTVPVCSPTKSGSSSLARPAHVVRGPREQRLGNSVLTNLASDPMSSITDSSLSQNATSGSSSPSSGKRYSVPPPITIPPNAQFCKPVAVSLTTTTGAALRLAGQALSANMSNNTTFLLSKTTPVRPSALKWAFTADDLAREREMEAATQPEKGEQSDSVSSSSESESDDSGKSSSSSSTPEESQCVERRGRARFSWRKSIPKDSNAAQPTADS